MFKVYREHNFETECLVPTPIELSSDWLIPGTPANIIGWPHQPVLTFNEALVIKILSITILDYAVCRKYLGSAPVMDVKMMCGLIVDEKTRITAVLNSIDSNNIQNFPPMNLRKLFYQKKFGKVVFFICLFIGR